MGLFDFFKKNKKKEETIVINQSQDLMSESLESVEPEQTSYSVFNQWWEKWNQYMSMSNEQKMSLEGKKLLEEVNRLEALKKELEQKEKAQSELLLADMKMMGERINSHANELSNQNNNSMQKLNQINQELYPTSRVHSDEFVDSVRRRNEEFEKLFPKGTVDNLENEDSYSSVRSR